MNYSVKSKPKPGEKLNGDTYLVVERDDFSLFCIIDGLGHGDKANEVSVQAREYIEKHVSTDLEGLVLGCHEYLQRTRGVVIGIILVNWLTETFSYIGVGNVEIRVKSENHMQPISLPGVVGYSIERMKRYDYPLERDMVFVMYTDGITSKIEKMSFTREADIDDQTQYIIDNYTRQHDDATIMIGVMS